jgi:glycogen phosphorylase
MRQQSVRDLRIDGRRLDSLGQEPFTGYPLTDTDLAGLTGADHTLHGRLAALARNLWWTWQPEVVALFRELDPIRWRELDHNPIALLSEFTPERLERRADELVLRSPINYAYRRLQEYLHSETTWAATHAAVLRVRPVAYFSAEFGLHESLPVYSGGLGVLAGDHLKSASDLDIPLVGVGLFYTQGYFLQHLDPGGWQREESRPTNIRQLPLEPATEANGQPVYVNVETRTGSLSARVWKLAVGRNLLLLLDSDIEGNSPEDRELTAHLYGGDNRVRIRQELLLGVGGVRALRALNIHPGVFHLNEGHSAFAVLEVIREHMQAEGIGFDEALKRVAAQTVFTTHTPIPAGHDRFPGALVEEHLGPLRESLGLSADGLLALGRVRPGDGGESFCMTVLALKLSRHANGVSALHGRVSRAMWTDLWPRRSEEEVPIGHITNGVHVSSWLAPQMRALYSRHLGVGWERRGGEPGAWAGIEAVDDGELWETHQALKARLVDFVRRRAVRNCQRRGEPPEVVEQATRALHPDTLTIGFARRFATYKRADLLLSDLDRLATLVNNPARPVQLVFAGKAHPHDEPGKRLLQQVARLTQDPRFAGRIVFIEDYDINVGRHLVQGVDVWLNTPRRPLEASGTSGMKVVLNGGLNLSILDGWWAEAYDGLNGFAVGLGETHSTPEVQDWRDAEALYRTLEKEVIPLYYDRDHDGLPGAWIARMKRAIRTLGWRFNADRMVMDYVRECYLPAAGALSCEMPRRAASRL